MKAVEQNALILPVGAFHSNDGTSKRRVRSGYYLTFIPSCPVYQNVTATAVSSPEEIKKT
jgi:[acyl-carrier-protein] S-malonyltransferase